MGFLTWGSMGGFTWGSMEVFNIVFYGRFSIGIYGKLAPVGELALGGQVRVAGMQTVLQTLERV